MGGMPSNESGARERALDALALSRRDGISLSRAARLTGVDRRTVLRHAGRGFERRGRRWHPRPFDRIPRAMRVLTPSGPTLVVVRDSRTASLLARHANAIQHYSLTGDTALLERLPRRSIRVGGKEVALVTAPQQIDRLAEGAELHYELYHR